MQTATESLPDDANALKALLIAERVQNERLRQIIKELQRHRFGRRAETLPEDQMLLGLEEVEQTHAEVSAKTENTAERAVQVLKRRMNRGLLPSHLPRIETIVDIADKTCPCCTGVLHRIGEDVSERLDIVPAQFRVIVVCRPKYACRACEDGVVQAPAPARLIEGGVPTMRRSRKFLYRSMPIISRCTGRRRSTPAKASFLIVRPWQIGWAVPPGCCVRSMSACSPC